MKVQNMVSAKGNSIPNQFIITGIPSEIKQEGNPTVVHMEQFQSYDSMIVRIYHYDDGVKKVFLDKHFWDYSLTTGKYRNQFLGETKKETQAKIDSGEYQLIDLNS